MADEECGTPEDPALTVYYDGKPFAVTRREHMRFVTEPQERMLFHPDSLAGLNPAYGHLDNNGTLVLTAINGTATYQHTDAQDGCLVFERVSWEPK